MLNLTFSSLIQPKVLDLRGASMRYISSLGPLTMLGTHFQVSNWKVTKFPNIYCDGNAKLYKYCKISAKLHNLRHPDRLLILFFVQFLSISKCNFFCRSEKVHFSSHHSLLLMAATPLLCPPQVLTVFTSSAVYLVLPKIAR